MISSHKIVVFALTLLATATSQITHSQPSDTDISPIANANAESVKKGKSYVRPPLSQKMQITPGLTGQHRYIIRLKNQPIASYNGDIQGLEATSPRFINSRNSTANFTANSISSSANKVDFASQQVKEYRSFLQSQQNQFIQKSAEKLNFTPEVLQDFQVAFNGVVLELTQDDAKKIAAMKEVVYVERDQLHQLDTFSSPQFIGADEVWTGSASQTPPEGRQGEGVIVGIIDSGINSDHPSFAATADDGYVHTNPLGDGVFIGDCAGAFASMCNNKLIGVRSYSTLTDAYDDTDVFGLNPPPKNGEDYDGHGTHVAATAIGNTLFDVDLISTEDVFVESDGINGTGFTFPRLSGVAPRANVIAYQVCYPGSTSSNPRDTYAGCFTSVMLQGINDAVADGVDVINMSISGGGNPWNYSIAQGFLNAQEAGVFVAVSAGNSGPEPATSLKNAPWYTAVAASTPDQNVTIDSNKTISNFSGGATTPPSTINGSANTQGITAPIVYAGDFTNPNDPGNDPAQCLQPFPAGTFTGQIVVCDRGSIARVQKAANVAAGGAGGYVLANVDGGAENLATDAYRVPGIQINAADGNRIRSWLSTGSGHTATISSASASQSAIVSDVVANFSARGPNSTVPDILIPQVSAPGVRIYAAFADQQFGHDNSTPTPGDYRFLQGTSMSSPHTAGAAALIKSVHPDWTPDQIRSALMTTANDTMTTQDSEPATIHDFGAGRIQVDQAVNAGLLMDETGANYRAADPDEGGDPKTLNIPSMGNTSCAGSCSWTRTFTAAQSGTWNISTSSDNTGIVYSVQPSSFTLTAGQTQSIEVTATITNTPTGQSGTGWILLTPTSGALPVQKLPAFVTVRNSSIEDFIALPINRDTGSIAIPDIEAIEITQLTTVISGMQKASRSTINVAQDPTNGDPYDISAGGVVQTNITLAADSPILLVELSDTQAPDLDLFVGFDSNGNGIAETSEELCQSISPSSDESCNIEEAEAGNYWILVQSFSASSATGTDSVTLSTNFIPAVDLGNLSVTGPASTPAFTPFDLRANWQDDMQEGDVFLATLAIASDANPGSTGNVANSVLQLTRGPDDVSISVDQQAVDPGDRVMFSIDIVQNRSPEDIDYTIVTTIPEGLTVDTSRIISTDPNDISLGTDGTGTTITWNTTRSSDPAGQVFPEWNLTFEADVESSGLGDGITVLMENTASTENTVTEISELTLAVSSNISINDLSVSSFDEDTTASIEVTYNDTDANPNTVQVSTDIGTVNNLTNTSSGATFDITPPTNFNGNIAVTVTVTDTVNASDSSSETFTVTVLPVNDAPTVSSTISQTLNNNVSTLTLTADAADVDGDTLTYSWSQTAGPSVTISNPTAAVATVSNANATSGTLTFQVTVSDGSLQATSESSIAVTAPPPPPPPPTPPPSNDNGGGGGGGSSDVLLLLLMLLSLGFYHTRRQQPVRSKQ